MRNDKSVSGHMNTVNKWNKEIDAYPTIPNPLDLETEKKIVFKLIEQGGLNGIIPYCPAVLELVKTIVPSFDFEATKMVLFLF